jgi:biopolymer transport protein ExbD
MSFGQMERGESSQPVSEINMTPLVDVMLVLLIIFIVTAPLLTHNVKVNLPNARTAASSIQSPIKIMMSQEGQIYLDGKGVGPQELEKELLREVAKGQQPTVELRADGALAYQQVVRLMAIVQNAGITKVSFITDPSGGGKAPVE